MCQQLNILYNKNFIILIFMSLIHCLILLCIYIWIHKIHFYSIGDNISAENILKIAVRCNIGKTCRQTSSFITKNIDFPQ